MHFFEAFTTGSSRDGGIWTYRIVSQSTERQSRALMRLFAGVCIVGGILLAVASFLITAHAPTL
jgi:hypothetical protein